MGDFVGSLSFSQSNQISIAGAQSQGSAYVLGYVANGFKVFVGQSNLPRWSSDKFEENKVKASTGASIYYTFGSTTVSAMAIRNETTWTTTTKYTDYSGLGVSHVMGPWDFGLAYQMVNTDSNLATGTNATQYALGVGYTIVKGTTAYFNMNSLGADKGAANTTAIGIKAAF
jgi:predicted dinucleotide-binding enzyme